MIPARTSVLMMTGEDKEGKWKYLHPVFGFVNNRPLQKVARKVPGRIESHFFERFSLVHLLAFLIAVMAREVDKTKSSHREWFPRRGVYTGSKIGEELRQSNPGLWRWLRSSACHRQSHSVTMDGISLQGR